MQPDQNPFFRKPIVPWYDTNFACWAIIILMVPVFAFAAVGIITGYRVQAFHDHIWFPAFLGFLSLFLMIKTGLRLKKRLKTG